MAELALSILENLASAKTSSELESDLVDLCGYEWMDDVTIFLHHRDLLVSSFEVNFSCSFSLFKNIFSVSRSPCESCKIILLVNI